jgi:nitrite reductase/ring-hydroxylating ferredoxin subunit
LPVDVGPETDFPPGRRSVIVSIGKRSIGIYNIDGQLYAVQNLCPHKLVPICLGQVAGTMIPCGPGELEYGMEDYVLRCFAHGWEFDIRTGRAVFDVDRRRLKTYPVSVEEGRVLVEVGGSRERAEATAAADDTE